MWIGRACFTSLFLGFDKDTLHKILGYQCLLPKIILLKTLFGNTFTKSDEKTLHEEEDNI